MAPVIRKSAVSYGIQVKSNSNRHSSIHVFDRVTEHTRDIEHLRKHSSSRTLCNIRSEGMARSGKSAGERSAERESRISGALNEIQSAKQPNWETISRKYRISRTTLDNWYFHRTQGWRDADVFQQKLSKEEEEEIVQWVKRIGWAGMPPRRRYFVDFVGTILVHRADHGGEERVGKRFTNWFLNRHHELRKRLARPLSSERASATDSLSINHLFDLLADVKSRFKIHPWNIWNADEKGFSLGVGGKEQVICESLNHFPRLVQDGTGEWVTLIESAVLKGIHYFHLLSIRERHIDLHDITMRLEIRQPLKGLPMGGLTKRFFYLGWNIILIDILDFQRESPPSLNHHHLHTTFSYWTIIPLMSTSTFSIIVCETTFMSTSFPLILPIFSNLLLSQFFPPFK